MDSSEIVTFPQIDRCHQYGDDRSLIAGRFTLGSLRVTCEATALQPVGRVLPNSATGMAGARRAPQ